MAGSFIHEDGVIVCCSWSSSNVVGSDVLQNCDATVHPARRLRIALRAWFVWFIWFLWSIWWF
jgi:hypothetical protein